MGTRTDISREVLDAVGTVENVRSLEHCTTRLRFGLVHPEQADTARIEALPGVISVVERGGQYQVVVGNDVADVYRGIINEAPQLAANTGSSNARQAESASDDGRSVGRRVSDAVFDYISGTFSPLLWALVGASLIKTLLTLLTTFNLLGTDSGTYGVLAAAGDAVFFFLPVFVGVTAAQKLGANPFVGGAIGATLLDANFTALGGAGKVSDFLGIPMVLMSYSSQVFPVMIAILLLALIERNLKRVITKNLHLVLIPAIGMLITVPLTVLVFGPFGVYLGEGIANGVTALSDVSSILTDALLAAAMLFLISLGLHWALVPIILANLASTGSDPILGAWAGYNFALIGVAVGVWIKSRRKDATLGGTALSGAVSGLLAGVSEPTVYGVVLRNRRLIPIVVVASAIGGGIAGAFKVTADAFLFQSLLTIPGFEPVGGYILAIAVAFIVGAALVLTFGYESKRPVVATAGSGTASATNSGAATAPTAAPKETDVSELSSPLTGTVVALSEVPDPVFAGGMLGAGVGIRPTAGALYAPLSGTIGSVASTKHAIGIYGDGGLEVLMHVGIDTVNLNGRYFRTHVENGDRVAAGDLLLEFDIDAITAAGYDVITPVVITARNGYDEPVVVADGTVSHGDRLLALDRAPVTQ